MPYQSRSQHRLFRALEAEGRFPIGTASRWAHETKDMKALPERKKPKCEDEECEKTAWATAMPQNAFTGWQRTMTNGRRNPFARARQNMRAASRQGVAPGLQLAQMPSLMDTSLKAGSWIDALTAKRASVDPNHPYGPDPNAPPAGAQPVPSSASERSQGQWWQGLVNLGNAYAGGNEAEAYKHYNAIKDSFPGWMRDAIDARVVNPGIQKYLAQLQETATRAVPRMARNALSIFRDIAKGPRPQMGLTPYQFNPGAKVNRTVNSNLGFTDTGTAVGGGVGSFNPWASSGMPNMTQRPFHSPSGPSQNWTSALGAASNAFGAVKQFMPQLPKLPNPFG